MQAVILAAGKGKRLKELTANNTKCMVKVNDVTLIERMLGQLDGLMLEKIVVVVGYEGQKLMDFIDSLNVKTRIEFVENPVYDKTNNIYSLSLARDYLLQDDTLLLESDIILEDGVLESLVEDERETLVLVDKYENWMDGTVIKIDEDDSIKEFVSKKNFVFEEISEYYKTVNVHKFSKEFSRTLYVPFLEAYTKALGNNEYYEQVLRVIALLDDPKIKAKRLNGQLWYEIDDIQDLDIAESLFAAQQSDKLEKIQGRFGGYWRYPKMLDFCYLVNPYYPPKRLMDEIKANFETLMTNYPSGMKVNSLLAAKNMGVRQEHIVVGNGAAELIKSLLEILKEKCSADAAVEKCSDDTTGEKCSDDTTGEKCGDDTTGEKCSDDTTGEKCGDVKMGIVSPTFEEYPNRYCDANIVRFVPESRDFSYDARDLMNFFDREENKIQIMVLVNPDNPTGNYINSGDMKELLEWSAKNSIKLIVDESFIDFAVECRCDGVASGGRVTYIDEAVLNKYPNLTVIKSISKSYGVPGLRLGVLACGDQQLISDVKQDLSIWNINSFAEFYMQIAEKYRKDYEAALGKFKKTRERLVKQLEELDGIQVFPTQANYIMCQLTSGKKSEELAQELLVNRNILIKDITPKMRKRGKEGEYIRVSVRNDCDNDKLVAALREQMLIE